MRTVKRLKKEWIKQCNRKALVCYLCGKLILKESEISAEHIIPKSQGGQATQDNLRPSHTICNNIRGTMEIEDFQDTLKNEYYNDIHKWWRVIHQRHLNKMRGK